MYVISEVITPSIYSHILFWFQQNLVTCFALTILFFSLDTSPQNKADETKQKQYQNSAIPKCQLT